jgi:hypothetical protein
MLRRLERESSNPPPPEVLEVADFRDKIAANQKALQRLKLPLPHPNACPKCFYLHGTTSIMRAIGHPNPNKFDLWKCDCGFEQEREIIK